MPRRRRQNNRLDIPHVRLYRWMLDCPAYLSLSCKARVVLLEIARGHDGTNKSATNFSVERLIVAHGRPASSPATKAAPRIGKRALTPQV